MASRKGTNIQKPDKTICMVDGCDRVATYKNPVKANQRAGGYCTKHKDLAVPSSRRGEAQGHDSFATWLDKREEREK